MKDAEGEDLVPISDAQKDLGLGPCLMLMTAKSIAYLFLVLAIMNIPIYLCFSYGHEDMKTGSMLSRFFLKYSIGNIGQEEPMCKKSIFRNNNYEDLVFTCENGKITDPTMFGIPLESEVECSAVDEKDEDIYAWQQFMKKKCNYNDGLFTEQGKQVFAEEFGKTCSNKASCTLRYSDFSKYISRDCRQIEETRRRENQGVILGGVRCMPSKVKLPFKLIEEVELYKQDMAYFIIFVDICSVISVIIFLVVIK
jgi:hypothetical protein